MNDATVSVLLFAATVAVGCAPPRPQAPDPRLAARPVMYTSELASVERPAIATERYGPQRISVVTDTGLPRYAFEDALVRAILVPMKDRVEFEVLNKTDHSIQIVWDEAAFLDLNGSSEHVMHEGMRFADRNAPQPPSVIIRGAKLDDAAIPSDNVEFTGGDWSTGTLLPQHIIADGDSVTLDSLRHAVVGKTFGLLLPLRIEDVTNEYLFTFRVTKVEPGESINEMMHHLRTLVDSVHAIEKQHGKDQ